MSYRNPSRRTVMLTKLRVAGFHDDRATFTRVYVEERISLAVAREQFAIGRQQRAAGVRCDCYECKAVV